MVFYSNSARTDLKNIFDALLTWSKHKLEYNHVVLYYNDILDICNLLDSKCFHFNTQFQTHKCFGQKVHNYRRNKLTGTLFTISTHTETFIYNVFCLIT